MNIASIITFSHRVELYVPSVQNDGAPIAESTRSGVVQEIGKQFSAIFGGATASEAGGFYQHLDGRMTVERVTVVYAFAEKLGKGTLEEISSLTRYIKEVCKQESVMMSIDGKAYLI